jgi:hypothetical protein
MGQERVHQREDEWFYVLEGELTFWVGAELVVAGPRGFVSWPRDIPHTFTVSSPQARFLLVTHPGAFDGFVRVLGQPAERLEIPDGSGAPPDMGLLVATAADTASRSSGRPGSRPDDAGKGSSGRPRSTPVWPCASMRLVLAFRVAACGWIHARHRY